MHWCYHRLGTKQVSRRYNGEARTGKGWPWHRGMPAPVTTPEKPRFASTNFAYDLTLDKTAPFWHLPIANAGVTLGSGPMMFFVGTMGDVGSQARNANLLATYYATGAD